jgi:hypothetical protein
VPKSASQSLSPPPASNAPALKVWDPAPIRELLDHLAPERLRLYWASKEFSAEAGAGAGAGASDAGACPAGGEEVSDAAAPGKSAEAGVCQAGTAVEGPAGEAAAGACAAGGARRLAGMVRTAPWDSEPIYGTRHCFEKLPTAWLAAWKDPSKVRRRRPRRPRGGEHAGPASLFGAHRLTLPLPPIGPQPAPRELHLPQANPFIPTDFALRPAPDGPAEPALVAGLGPGSEGRLRLFFRTELRFKTPKAVVYLDFQVRLGV